MTACSNSFPAWGTDQIFLAALLRRTKMGRVFPRAPWRVSLNNLTIRNAHTRGHKGSTEETAHRGCGPPQNPQAISGHMLNEAPEPVVQAPFLFHALQRCASILAQGDGLLTWTLAPDVVDSFVCSGRRIPACALHSGRLRRPLPRRTRHVACRTGRFLQSAPLRPPRHVDLHPPTQGWGSITKRVRGSTEAVLDAIVGWVTTADDGLFDLETGAVPMILVVPDFSSCTPHPAGRLPA